MSSDLEILESLQEFGTKQFSKVKKSDRNLYGKEFGKDSLTAFAKYIDPKFEDPLHIKSIIHLLEEMEKGKITRTIINMPPRRGKSQICTRIFPTWFLGRHPDKNVILLSYSDKKAARFGRWVRDCVESSKFQHVFPECKVRPDMRSAGEWQTTKEGLVLSAGLKVDSMAKVLIFLSSMIHIKTWKKPLRKPFLRRSLRTLCQSVRLVSHPQRLF
ncbi:hypothetical protein LIBAT_07770 [Leptospira interrogans]